MSKFEQVKNWPWKRILIGTAVVSSIAASSSFGTYAYFTSQANESTAFAAGKLEIGIGKSAATFKADDDHPFLPGVRFEKDLTIENNSDVPVKYALLANKTNGDDVVYNQLMVEVRRGGSGGELLFLGRVNQLSQANVIVPELGKGGHDLLHFSVYLPESTGNEVQMKSAEVDFGFLATQQENGEYFAQKGPVMTFTPEDFARGKLDDTLQVMKTSAEGSTFILGEGTYNLPDGKDIYGNVTWKAARGKEGKVVVQADQLRVKDTSFDGITFKGSGVGLFVESNVSFVNCTFEGNFEAAIQTVESKEGSLEGLTVKNSTFAGGKNGIVLNQEIKGVMVSGNTFAGVNHAIAVDNEKHSQLQVVHNDFSKVNQYAVESNGVRVGDGIEGFAETKEENQETAKLALHLRQADIYLEENKYK